MINKCFFLILCSVHKHISFQKALCIIPINDIGLYCLVLDVITDYSMETHWRGLIHIWFISFFKSAESAVQTNSSLLIITKFNYFEWIASMHVLLNFTNPSRKITSEKGGNRKTWTFTYAWNDFVKFFESPSECYMTTIYHFTKYWSLTLQIFNA